MRAYIITTGVAAALLALAHAARVAQEGAHLLLQPVFLLTSLASVGLCAWALVLLARLRRRDR